MITTAAGGADGGASTHRAGDQAADRHGRPRDAVDGSCAATFRAAVGRGRSHARACEEDAKPDRRSDQPAAPEQSELRLWRQGRAPLQQHPVRAQHPAGGAGQGRRGLEPHHAADHPGAPPARPDRWRRDLGLGRHPASDLPVALRDRQGNLGHRPRVPVSERDQRQGSSAPRSGAPARAWSC